MERVSWFGGSVAAATTVPSRMRVLTVSKLGPPAQDLIGAVLPTATRHAGGRVVDFKSARQAGRQDWVQEAACLRPTPSPKPENSSTPRRAGDQARGTPTSSHQPQTRWSGSSGDRINGGQDQEKGPEAGISCTPSATPGPSSLLQRFSEELVGAMIVLKYR